MSRMSSGSARRRRSSGRGLGLVEGLDEQGCFGVAILVVDAFDSVDRTANVYIRWVQGGLNRILGLSLTVDGVLGPMTKAAIRDFQTKQGLTADGVVGQATEQALVRAGAGNPPATPAPSTTGVNSLLPASGPGFYSKPESWPYRQYGIPETIAAIQAIGRAW